QATLESAAFTPETPPARRRESARPPQLTAPGIAPRPPAQPRPPTPPRSGTLESPAPGARPRFGFGSTATLESPRVPPRTGGAAGNPSAPPPPRPPERKFGGTMVMPDAAPPAAVASDRPRYDEDLDDDQTAVMDSALLGSTLMLDHARGPLPQAALRPPSVAPPAAEVVEPPASPLRAPPAPAVAPPVPA